MSVQEVVSAEETFETLFWDAVKTRKDQNPDMSYLDLGGTSLGIFVFTEAVKKELGVEVPPEAMLEDDATLSNLKSKYLKG